jgi:hypothetical protein
MLRIMEAPRGKLFVLFFVLKGHDNRVVRDRYELILHKIRQREKATDQNSGLYDRDNKGKHRSTKSNTRKIIDCSRKPSCHRTDFSSRTEYFFILSRTAHFYGEQPCRSGDIYRPSGPSSLLAIICLWSHHILSKIDRVTQPPNPNDQPKSIESSETHRYVQAYKGQVH